MIRELFCLATELGAQVSHSRRRVGRPLWAAWISLAFAVSFAGRARAEGLAPPWVDSDDLPLPEWARSVVPRTADAYVHEAPAQSSPRRGVTAMGSHPPIFAAKRGPGCAARWFMIGPSAWICSDGAGFASEERTGRGHLALDELLRAYYFVGREGTRAYSRLDSAGEVGWERELEPGWAVSIVEQARAHGRVWGRTPRGQWIEMSDLGPAHPSTFQGEKVISGDLQFAWVRDDRAKVFASPSLTRVVRERSRFDKVQWLDDRTGPLGRMVRVGDEEWMQARDLVRPERTEPPAEVLARAPREPWIDVHLATQTLVAYEGRDPVYATLVSTGRGAQGTDSATPRGLHRIWVKLATSTMDNVEREDVGRHYSMEDVPYVQFFAKAVALHGTYWHRDFGRVKSHGCVNLAPRDAEWLFQFTSPKLPLGWNAVYPTASQPGAWVQVR